MATISKTYKFLEELAPKNLKL